jgi:hypothetical protein
VNDDAPRLVEIERLRQRRSDAAARRASLVKEADEFATRLGEIRTTFGNPYFYSHPSQPDESSANYTGASSHKVVLPTVLALRRVERELGEIDQRLRDLGASPD